MIRILWHNIGLGRRLNIFSVNIYNIIGRLALIAFREINEENMVIRKVSLPCTHQENERDKQNDN